ncbi:MAG TPA: hypothetical protein VGQ47_02720 [Candidatus Limnocylindrales bacterium]|jgi:hypothetical protein|nr:hypothetical protein [Candidatus Limnocylindrales bacterium]
MADPADGGPQPVRAESARRSLLLWALIGGAVVALAVLGRGPTAAPPRIGAAAVAAASPQGAGTPAVASPTASPALPQPVLDGPAVGGPVLILEPKPGAIVPGDGLFEIRAVTDLHDVFGLDVAITSEAGLVRLFQLPLRSGRLAGWIRLEPGRDPIGLRLVISRPGQTPLAELPFVLDAEQPLRITTPWLPDERVRNGVLVVSGRAGPGLERVTVRVERPSGRVLARASVPVRPDLTHAPAFDFFSARLRLADPPPGTLWIIVHAEDAVSGRIVSDSIPVQVPPPPG